MSIQTVVGTQAALLTLGAVVLAAPAHAGTFTVDIDGYVLVETIELDPSLQLFFPEAVTALEAYKGTQKEFSLLGLELLDDPAQYTDGEITLDATFVDSLYGDLLTVSTTAFLGELGLTPELAVDTADAIFDITLTGDGTLSNANGTSPFSVDYDSATNAISVTEYDNDVVGTCVVDDCMIDGSLAVSLSVMVDEFIAFSDGLLNNLNLEIPDETRQLIKDAQWLLSVAALSGGESLALGDATVSYDFSTKVAQADSLNLEDSFEPTVPTVGIPAPPESIPEPGMLLGLASAAGVALMRRSAIRSRA